MRAKLMLRADRQKVVQILVNLLSNAIEFTPSGGPIAVRFAPAARRLPIGMRDSEPASTELLLTLGLDSRALAS